MKRDVAEYLEFAFEKLDCLKESDFGEVWRCRRRSDDEIVILKRVRRINLPYDALKSNNFTLPAKIFLCSADDSETVIVEEFIHGENLLTRLEQKNFLSEAEARDILLQMCDGLRELHAKKIIHRDIKPSNLILQGERIRLIDFDAARIFKPDKNVDTQLFGTKGYAPPEQYGGRQTDERSDIYSLGVTMKVLLGGNLRGHLKKILDTCTEFDPKNRFQNVDELKAALTEEFFDENETDLPDENSEQPQKIPASMILHVLRLFLLVNTRHKKILALIIFAATEIFFVANMSTLNGDENFPEPIVEHAKEIPPVVEEKISEKIPAQVSEFKLPTIVTEQIKFQPVEIPKTVTSPQKIELPSMEIPQLQPVKPVEIPQPVTPEKNYSGLIKTEFFLNNSPFNQFEHMGSHTPISRDEWRQTQARLHIVNDSGKIWSNPRVKFILGQNWGDKFTDTKILPALNVDESTDVVIPFELLTVSDRKNTSAYIQIWLEGDGADSDEKYWCEWFDVTD